MEIKGILVSLLAPMENHIANGGEKLLGNASSIKQRPDGRVYISGQMQRHALFCAIERLNLEDPNRGNTYVSNGDGISNAIEVDLRADMGGFMHPKAGNYSGRRTSPISVTPAVALEKSEIGRDLLIRLKMDTSGESREQALATREFSEHDMMLMNFHLDVASLSITKLFEYGDKNEVEGVHLKTKFVKHVKEEERKRRARLFLEATRFLTDYAQQARNATTGEPQKVLIVFDTKLSRKACRYFEANDVEKQNILNELNERGAKVILGSDIEYGKSVNAAYKEALEFLAATENTLYDPCSGDNEIKTFAETFKTK
ncbi:MAG: type I-PGING CRISPR-associated protein Cas7/Csp1 [Chloroherpetonaceae bacterium]|nr:type I-PGING CRISPR-associated protein Cas7/Csp1 [Chloroherpetonaceae bacterium]